MIRCLALLLALLTLLATPARAALDHDGVNDQVAHGDIAAIDGAAALTVCFWIKPDVLATAEGMAGKGYALLHRTGGADSALLEVYTSNVPERGDVGSMFVNGTWVHVCSVFNGAGAGNDTRLLIYKNGVAQVVSFTGTIQATLPDAGATEFIMGFNAAATGYIDAQIAHVKVWTAALSAAEVYNEMNTQRPQRTANLILWAPYDDATSARDYSGSGNNGTVTGATQSAGPPVSYGGRQ